MVNSMVEEFSLDRMDVNRGLTQRKLVQCRICHDEDEPSKMETPCACSGSLKYAHRRCVQMWCNEKGDTICEICQQQFKPGYSAPPPRVPIAMFPVHLREPWEFPRNDQYNHPSIVAAQHNFFEHSFNDYPVPTASIVCCRIIAIIFVVLLVLRHTLPIVLNGAGEYSYTLYTLLMLRTIGILLPVCVMLKACSIIRNHRRHRPMKKMMLYAHSLQLILSMFSNIDSIKGEPIVQMNISAMFYTKACSKCRHNLGDSLPKKPDA